MDITIFMNKAISQTGAISKNTEFNLKDLFDGVEWGTMTKGDRQRLGKMFKNEVLEGNIPNIVYLGKSENNSALYMKG